MRSQRAIKAMRLLLNTFLNLIDFAIFNCISASPQYIMITSRARFGAITLSISILFTSPCSFSLSPPLSRPPFAEEAH